MAASAASAASAAAAASSSSSFFSRLRPTSRLLLLLHRGAGYPLFPAGGRPRTAAPLLLLGARPALLNPSPVTASSSKGFLVPRWRRFCSGTPSTETAAVDAPPEAGRSVREYRSRLKVADVRGGPDEGVEWLGREVVFRGWVRTCRVQSSVTFIEVNDGSCLSNMQCVMSSDAEGYDQVESGFVTTGASVLVEGIVVSSQGTKQKVELKVARLVLIGRSDPLAYPIQKKRVSNEFLRTIAHLRPRTNTFGAVTRVRNALAFATHKFFQENGFVWVASPIITASDCEGAGEQFCVTTLIPNTHDGTHCPVNTIAATKDGKVDWSQDFFGKPAFLTVSGQLNAETYASALCDVYTFGPTFRAENSNTSRHLAEFWMIEPELAFADLNDDMACATAYLQYVVKYILENCKEDMEFFNTWIEKGLISRLNDVVEKDFIQLTYSDAVALLLKAKKKFEFPVIHVSVIPWHKKVRSALFDYNCA